VVEVLGDMGEYRVYKKIRPRHSRFIDRFFCAQKMIWAFGLGGVVTPIVMASERKRKKSLANVAAPNKVRDRGFVDEV